MIGKICAIHHISQTPFVVLVRRLIKRIWIIISKQTNMFALLFWDIVVFYFMYGGTEICFVPEKSRTTGKELK